MFQFQYGAIKSDSEQIKDWRFNSNMVRLKVTQLLLKGVNSFNSNMVRLKG